MKPVRTLIACAFLIAILVWTHALSTDWIGRKTIPADSVLVPSPEVVKLVSLGYDQTLSDLFWLAFVQYVGDVSARTQDHYRLAHEYLHLITSLDPKLVQAYWFAAFVLGGDLNQPELAAQIIENGLQSNQDDWHIPCIAGINQYLFAHDEKAAARYYRMAAKFSGAPDWLTGQAQILEADIPARIKEIRTWESVSESSKDYMVKERAKARLIRLWLEVLEAAPTERMRTVAVESLHRLGVQPRRAGEN